MSSTNNDSLSPARRRIGAALISLTGFILVASSATKFAGLPPIVQQLEDFGFAGKLTLLGVIEATTAVLFLVPKTRALALLLFPVFMGGAITTHLQHGELPVPPAIVLGLAWLGRWLRHPVAFWSFAPTSEVVGIVGRHAECVGCHLQIHDDDQSEESAHDSRHLRAGKSGAHGRKYSHRVGHQRRRALRLEGRQSPVGRIMACVGRLGVGGSELALPSAFHA